MTMNRDAFLQRLELLLQDIAQEERTEAIRFYNEYFDEAGESEESHILAELGSPEKVAAIIKANVPAAQAAATPTLSTEGIDWQAQSEARQQAMKNTNPDNIPLPAYARLAPVAPPTPGFGENAGTQQPNPAAYQQPVQGQSSSPLWIVLKVLVAICVLPVVVGLVAGLGGGLVGLVAAGIALVVAGIACMVGAVIVLASNGAAAFAVTGTGLLLVALMLLAAVIGLAVMALGIWFCCVAIPAIWKGLWTACKWVFGLFFTRRGGAYA